MIAPLFFNILPLALFLTLGIAIVRKGLSPWICLGAGAFIALVGWWIQGRPDIFTLFFPFSGAIYFTNFFPFAVAVAAPGAFVFGKNRFQKIRIVCLLCLLLLVSMKPWAWYFKPLAETGPLFIDSNGVCRQSSPYTCSAASCVTLLRLHGVEATEEEVVRLALTRDFTGTRPLGEYRALKIITRKSGRDLHVKFRNITPDELLTRNQPALITVGMHKGNPVGQKERDMVEKYQWSPGVMHDVVFLGIKQDEPDMIRIGEPDFGLEVWQAAALDILFQGHALYIE